MPIEVKGPDGVTHEFPDGTSPDIIKGVMVRHYGAPAAPAVSAAAPIEIKGPDGAIHEFPAGTNPDVIRGALTKHYGASAQTPATPGPISFNDLIPAQRPAAPPAQSLTFDDLVPAKQAPDSAALVQRLREDLASQLPAVAAAAPPPDTRSTWQKTKDAAAYAGGVADKASQGIARGAVNVAALPVDLPAAAYGAEKWLAGKIGVPEKYMQYINPVGAAAAAAQPYAGGEAANAGLDRASVALNEKLGLAPPSLEPRNLAERIVGRVGQEIGGAALPVGAGLGLARRGVDAVRESGPVVRALAEKAAVDRAKFLGRELGVATTAGLGAGLADAATNAAGYDEHTWQGKAADLVGALSGAGAAGVANHVGPKAKEIYQAVTRNSGYTDKVVKQAVTDDLARMFGAPDAQLGPRGTFNAAPAAAEIENGRRVGDTIPGFQETLATRTQSPVIAALEAQRQRGENSAIFTARQDANSRAVDNALSANAPNGQPGALRAALDDARERQLSEAAGKAQDARTALEGGRESAKQTLDLLAQKHLDDLDAALAAHKDAQAVAAQRGAAVVDEARAPLAPIMNADARGADIRGVLADRLENDMRPQERALWRVVDQGGGNADIAPLADRFDAITRGLSEAERQRFVPAEAGIPARLMPEAGAAPSASGLLDASGAPIVRPAQAPTSAQPISELTGLRSALTDAARQAATAGEANKARVIGQYIDAVDAHLDAVMPAELRSAYDRARAFSRDLNDRFTRPQTAIGQTLAETQGVPRLPDSAIPRKFTQADEGRVADFEALRREAGDDPRALAAVRDQVLADVRDRGLLDNPNGLQRYTAANSRVLEAFPAVRDQLARLAQAQANTAQRAAALKEFERNGLAGLKGAQGQELAATKARAAQELDRLQQAHRAAQDAERGLVRDLGDPMTGTSGRTAVGQYLRFGDENSERAMRGVMNSAKPGEAADQLLNFAGNSRESVEGARQIFWNMMQQDGRGRSGAWAPERLSTFLSDPGKAAVAARLYRDDPEHLENIKKIADAMRGVDLQAAKAQAPKLTGPDKTSIFSSQLTPETLQSRILSYERGQIGGAFLVTSLAATIARRAIRESQGKAISRLMDQALTNPDFAAALLRENNPANRAALARSARGWAGNEAATIANLIDGDDDPVKKAVLRSGRAAASR
ncbi:hypothetical protein M2322_002768 [Rhodoblastus acidophilus]|uniref:hypothetical protein n=1 Tax=Rhodoblastus acidophilus TaxID=1074 RepID=UPI002224D6B4|nr:hypothetical protein [Rhodoblastus acidophilus]MCW2317214.1 hypothetical protein [Rhodoblastus acidophilus]